MPQRIKRRSEIKPRIGRSAASLHRPTSRELGYDAAWDRVAKRRREIDNWLCQACLENERLTVSTDVDHIIPMHVRYDWRLELDNTQVLCRMHHRQKTQRDNEQYGSSIATSLTEAQQAARGAARGLLTPPRGVGGYLKPKSVSSPYRGVRCACLSAKLGRGGMP